VTRAEVPSAATSETATTKIKIEVEAVAWRLARATPTLPGVLWWEGAQAAVREEGGLSA